MTLWGTIREINPLVESTWKSRLFLTVDVDWAPDFVIEDCLNFLGTYQIPTTWFATHETTLLKSEIPKFRELGVHPNFSPLITSPGRTINAEEVVNTSMKLVPAATSFRNHSLVQSSPLLNMFKDRGFTHDCNVFLPYTPINALAPWFHWNGLIRVPHCWEDDVWILGGCRDIDDVVKASNKGLAVIDIHPIHIYLNTTSWEVYEKSKTVSSDRAKMEDLKAASSGCGVRTVVEQLLESLR